MQIKSYEISGKYREFYSKGYFIPPKTRLYGISLLRESEEFHFIFSGLSKRFDEDKKRLLKNDSSQDNMFIWTRNLF